MKPKFTTHNPYSSVESGRIMPKHKTANEPDVVRLRVRNTDDGVERHAPSKSKSYSYGAGKSDDSNRRVNDDAARSKSKPFCDAVWGTCICYREAGHEKKGRYSGHWWTVAPQEIQSR